MEKTLRNMFDKFTMEQNAKIDTIYNDLNSKIDTICNDLNGMNAKIDKLNKEIIRIDTTSSALHEKVRKIASVSWKY